MLHTLNKGDKVKVWPRPGLTVKVGPEVMSGGKMLPVRALAAEGETVLWSEWFHDLAKGGALFFSDPNAGGGVQHAKHVRHPNESSENDKPAHAGGAHSAEELAHWAAFGLKDAKLSERAKAEAEVAADGKKE
jgi:hypothetical protein